MLVPHEAEISVLEIEDPDIGVALCRIQDNEQDAILPDDASERHHTLSTMCSIVSGVDRVEFGGYG